MTARRALVPIALAVGLGVLYVLVTPHSTDLSAQVARQELYRRSGFVPYWTGWYGGVSTTSYSLVTPILLGAFGAIWLGALSVVATAAVVVPLLRDALRPTIGAGAFTVAAYLDVVSGRTTFAVGAVVALAAMLAAERRRTAAAVLLGALATVTSPVAGVLLLVVVAALVVADPDRRLAAVGLGAGIGIGLVVIAIASHGSPSGYQPFSLASFLIATATALVVGLSPVGRRVRWGVAATIVLLAGSYAVHSAVGSNTLRLTTLVAVPVVIAAVELPPLQVAVVALLASYPMVTQLQYDVDRAPVHDYSRSFTAPLVQQLSANPLIRNHRVELVDTATHWPSTYLLPTVMLARGWERQIDESANPIFYGGAPLTAASYRAFLDRNAVGLVAMVTGEPLDYGSTKEAALIRHGLPYLHEVWSSDHWVLYAVTAPTPIVSAPATVVRHTDTGVTVVTPASGRYLLRLRWSPYLVADGGLLTRAPGDNVLLSVRTAGAHRIHARWRWPL